MTPSLRAQVVTRRTYNRPLDDSGKVFETWEQTVDRVIDHQAWLWNRATESKPQSEAEFYDKFIELNELRKLMLERKVLTSGRTLWLGGTDVAKRREASQFNCSFTHVETVYDVVDVLWLLLQGCGVGFRPIIGQLTGFVRPIPVITVVRSERTIEQFNTGKRGEQDNSEHWNPDTKTWTISVGDSAEAWAKSIGKLLAGKYPADELVLDFSQIRPAGIRLSGYGWISSGDAAIARAYEAIVGILNKRAGNLLSRIDILDLVNWLGTVLSSRRSAEIALFPFGEDEWEEFAVAKREFWKDNPQRSQSNNSLLFRNRPTHEELTKIFNMMVESGGSEPGFINQQTATKRAPWFKGVNPCAEILLGNKSFCNLMEVDLGKFRGDSAGLSRAVELAARACYRQTCVDLRDGILQEAWHLNNSFLRLLGVGLTGVVRRPDLSAYDYATLQRVAVAGAYGMADELGLPRPKNVTTIKPSGTVSKIMDTTEGVHKPLGKYILNNINFSKHDPLVAKCREAGYRVFANPTDPDGVLVTFPVQWDGVEFDEVDGKEINNESALVQLERYKMLMQNWCQQNVSCTVSYSVEEVPVIVDWLIQNWDYYVGVSFLFRADPTKTAADLGYLYLPQEVVTKEVYESYSKSLMPLTLDEANSFEEIREEECAGGVCPIR
jgi:ribonucleoside-triphosphate reductase (formate)